MGDHDPAAKAVDPRSKGDALSVIAPGGGDDRGHIGMIPAQPVEVAQSAPNFESPGGKMVFVFGPDGQAFPAGGLEERPANLRGRGQVRPDDAFCITDHFGGEIIEALQGSGHDKSLGRPGPCRGGDKSGRLSRINGAVQSVPFQRRSHDDSIGMGQ